MHNHYSQNIIVLE